MTKFRRRTNIFKRTVNIVEKINEFNRIHEIDREYSLDHQSNSTIAEPVAEQHLPELISQNSSNDNCVIESQTPVSPKVSVIECPKNINDMPQSLLDRMNQNLCTDELGISAPSSPSPRVKVKARFVEQNEVTVHEKVENNSSFEENGTAVVFQTEEMVEVVVESSETSSKVEKVEDLIETKKTTETVETIGLRGEDTVPFLEK